MPEQTSNPAATALFGETQVLSENQHEQGNIKDMSVNESVGFYFDNQKTANSEEYGEFTICQGLKINLQSATIDSLVETATPFSFIPNTLLMNKIIDGSLTEGEAYRIEKTWEKGQKFKDGTKAKGYGFTLFHQNMAPQIKTTLASAYKEKLNPLNITENTDSDSDSDTAPVTPNIPQV